MEKALRLRSVYCLATACALLLQSGDTFAAGRDNTASPSVAPANSLPLAAVPPEVATAGNVNVPVLTIANPNPSVHTPPVIDPGNFALAPGRIEPTVAIATGPIHRPTPPVFDPNPLNRPFPHRVPPSSGGGGSADGGTTPENLPPNVLNNQFGQNNNGPFVPTTGGTSGGFNPEAFGAPAAGPGARLGISSGGNIEASWVSCINKYLNSDQPFDCRSGSN